MYVKAFGTDKEVDKRNPFPSLFDPIEIPKDYSLPSEETLERIERLMIFNTHLTRQDEINFEKLNKIIKECPKLNHIYLCNMTILLKEFFNHLNSKSLKSITFYSYHKREMLEIAELLSNYSLNKEEGKKIEESVKDINKENRIYNAFVYENFNTDKSEELVNSIKTPNLKRIFSLSNYLVNFSELRQDLIDIGKLYLVMGADSSTYKYTPVEILFKMPYCMDAHIFLKR